MGEKKSEQAAAEKTGRHGEKKVHGGGRYRIAIFRRNAFRGAVRWGVLIGLGWAVVAVAAPWRVGLLGPARDDAAWLAVQLGWRRGMAGEACEWIDHTPRRPGPEAVVAACRGLREDSVDLVVVMTRGGLAQADWDALSPGWKPLVFSIGEPLPPGVSAAHWSIDWAEWAAWTQIAAVDASPRREGRLGLEGAGGAVPGAAWERLGESRHWPSTGRWRWATSAESAVEVRIVGERGILLGAETAPRVPTIAVWLDALTLTRLQEGQLAAIVTPHYVEAGEQMAARWRRGAERAYPAAHYEVGPILLTADNVGAWVELWRRWQD